MLVTLDFETAYSSKDKFSLRSMTQEQYVRSERFQVIGFSYKLGTAAPVWVSGTDEHIAQSLHALDLPSNIVCCHNAVFDCFILSHHYGIRPKRIVCTLSMAAACGLRARAGGSLAKLAEFFGLGQKGNEVIAADGLRREDFGTEQMAAYARYCDLDTQLCYDLLLKLKNRVTPHDIVAIDCITKMYTEPVFELDGPLLRARLEVVKRQKADALIAISDQLGVTPDEVGEQLRSAAKFTELLTGRGIEVPMKVTPAEAQKASNEGRAPREVPAVAKTDAFMDSLLEHSDPFVVALAEGRLGERSNIEGTRLQRFVGIASRGALPVPLTYAAAHTGRLGGSSGSGINVQNLPKRGGADTTIRQSMRAPKGHKIVSGDSSQVEARLLAWMAGQDDLVQLFARGGDPYSDMAAYATGRDAATIRTEAKAGVEPGKTQRDEGKATVLGAGFNMGGVRYREARRQAGAIITQEQADHAITAYRQKNPHITQLWRAMNNVLKRMLMGESFHFGGPSGMLFKVGHAPLTSAQCEPYIELPNGTRLWYEGLTTQQGDKGLEFVYRKPDEKTRRILWARTFGGSVTENVTQALAFAALKWQVFDTGFSQRWKLAINVHDSWSAIVPEAQAEECLADLLNCMSTAPSWLQGMPFAAEGSISDDYAGAQ